MKYANENHMATCSGESVVRASSFIAKPTQPGGYENRRMDLYVGIYVLRGTARFTDHVGKTHTVRAGDFLQMPPQLPHSVVHEPDGQWVEAWLTLRPEFMAMLMQLGIFCYEKTVMSPGLHHGLIADFEHLQAEMRQVDAFTGLRSAVAAQQLLLRVYMQDAAAAPRDPHQQIVDELCQLLSQDLEQRVDLPELSARFPLSYERLRKIFKQRTGFSLADYRIRKRVELAQTLLEHQQLPIKQVAQVLGYPDPFTFSRQFRKFTGRAPSSYLVR